MPTTQPNFEEGPFSAVFPYEELAKEEEEKKQKLQQGQQRIQRTNAIGDSLRLIIDSVGAFKGANVTPKGINPGIMRASERMRQVQDQSDDTMMRLRLTDLGNRQKDVAYQQGIEAENRAAGRRAGEIAQQREWEVADTDKKLQFQAEQAEKGGQRAMELEDRRSQNDMQQIYAREAAKKKEEELANPFLARFRRSNGETKSPYLVIPDTEIAADIPLSEGDALKIMSWMRRDPAMKSKLRIYGLDTGKLSNNIKLKDAVVEHWDTYKDMVRRLASGQTITPADEEAFYKNSARQMRVQEYETRRSQIDVSRKKGAKQLEQLNTEYKDIFDEGASAGGGISLQPEETAKIDGIINAEGYSAEQKRSAAFSYLKGQGYDDAAAKEFAEFVYQNLK
jgi:hypothetical protein